MSWLAWLALGFAIGAAAGVALTFVASAVVIGARYEELAETENWLSGRR